jgi:RHS repeat-associated protein
VDQQTASGVATGTAKTRYIHPDHLGSTNVVTDENDAVVQTLDYYPYGAIRVSSATSTNERRKYIGQFADDSGLNYLQARYEDPQRAQFMSEDPVFQAIGDNNQVNQLAQRDQQAILNDPQQLNSYEYARENPVTLSDPNGRILPIILGALAVYSAAQISIDAYDVYQTDYKYADVFSPEEKSRTNFKLGYDVGLTAVGGQAASVGLKGLGTALGFLGVAQDTLDTYFGKQVYKTYNEELSRKKLDQTGVNVSSPLISLPSSVPAYSRTGSYSSPVPGSFAGAHYSGASVGSGGSVSSYGQLISNLSRLVASLTAYVSSLTASKGK